MIILYILAGIVCFFLLLGLLPLRVRVRYGEELGLTAGIGAITLFRIPSPKNTSVRLRDFTHTRHRKRLARDAARNQKKAKRLAEKAEAKKQKKEQKAQQKEERKTTGHPEDETGLTDKIAEILDLVSLVLEELPRLFGRFHCKISRMHIFVGGKDAASAAVNFGIVSQAAAYLLEVLDTHTHLHKPKANSIVVKVDFLREKSKMDIDFTLQVRVGSILHTGISLLIGYIRSKL